MGNRILLIWFFGLMGIYFLARYLRVHYDQLPPFFKHQFTDLLFVPVMCILALFFVRVFKRDHTIDISPWLVLLQVVLVSLYFEWYLPKYQSHVHPYTTDNWDVLMYFFGGGIFLILQRYLFHNKKVSA
jgi:branched-subunit amino acid transport protein